MLKSDHGAYLESAVLQEGGVAADLHSNNGNNGRPYSIRMKIDNDIIAPSYNKSIEAFIKTVEASGGRKKFANDNFDKRRAKEFIKNYKNITVSDARDRAYVSFVSSFMRDTDAKKMFFNILKSEGYNVVIDEWDNKFGKGFSKSPIIVFDKSKTLKQTKSTPLSEEDFKYFSDRVWGGSIEDSKRKYQKSAKKWEGY